MGWGTAQANQAPLGLESLRGHGPARLADGRDGAEPGTRRGAWRGARCASPAARRRYGAGVISPGSAGGIVIRSPTAIWFAFLICGFAARTWSTVTLNCAAIPESVSPCLTT